MLLNVQRTRGLTSCLSCWPIKWVGPKHISFLRRLAPLQSGVERQLPPLMGDQLPYFLSMRCRCVPSEEMDWKKWHVGKTRDTILYLQRKWSYSLLAGLSPKPDSFGISFLIFPGFNLRRQGSRPRDVEIALEQIRTVAPEVLPPHWFRPSPSHLCFLTSGCNFVRR